MYQTAVSRQTTLNRPTALSRPMKSVNEKLVFEKKTEISYEICLKPFGMLLVAYVPPILLLSVVSVV